MDRERTPEVAEHPRQDDEQRMNEDRNGHEDHKPDTHPGHRVKPPRPFGAN